MCNLNNKIKINLVLLINLVMFPLISETIYTPALPAISENLKTSPQLVEATLSIYFIGFAVGVLFWGALSDRIGRRKAMLMGIVLFVVSTLFCGRCQSIESLLFWRSIQAIGASVGSIISQTMIRDVYEGKERAKIFSIIVGALSFSPAIGPLLGGTISEIYGWRANFSLLSLIGIGVLIFSYLKLPETRPKHLEKVGIRTIAVMTKRMINSKLLWGHVFLIAATNGILFSFYSEAPFIFIDQLGLRPSQYGCLGFMIALATLAAARISYTCNQIMNEERIIMMGSLLSVLGSFGLVALKGCGAFSLAPLSFGMILSFLFTIFIGIGLVIPNSLTIAVRPYKESLGVAGSIFGGIYYSFIALATWGMSQIHNGTTWPLPLYLASLSVMLLVASYVVKPERVETPTVQQGF